jgi:hypothetical protein
MEVAQRPPCSLRDRQANGRFRLRRKPGEAPGSDFFWGNPNPAPPLCLFSVSPWWVLND